MKSIFIDCNNQLAPVFTRVQRPDDPPIAINRDPFQSADLPRLLAGYEVCLDDHSYMPTEAMAQCRGLKHIVFLGTGASSYMDVPALNRLGIEVHTIKGYGDVAVAEHTMALIFACCRDLARMDRAVRGGVWDPLESMQLNGKTLGLIGLGGIGGEVARIARGVGMEVIGWNRSPRPHAGVPLVGLDVFHAEPLRTDHPLARMENVTLTSHAAFRTLEASETLMRRAIDIVCRLAAPSP
jgi:D-3-phosphoglycerate dehydrogenase